MANAPEHLRLTYSGTFGAGASASEIWSHGLSLQVGPGGPDLGGFLSRAELQTAVDSLTLAWSLLRPAIAGPVVLTRTRVSFVKADGLTAIEANGAYLQADSFRTEAAAGVRVMPNQITAAITLHSAGSGPTGRGRFFLPLPITGTLEDDGRLGPGAASAIRGQAKLFVQDVNSRAAAAQIGPVIIASGGSILKGIAPALRQVNAVSVGRVLDTMRSRRGSLLEERVLLPL